MKLCCVGWPLAHNFLTLAAQILRLQVIRVGYSGQLITSPQPSSFQAITNFKHALIFIKADGVQQGLVGKLFKGFVQKGFHLVNIKFLQVCENHLKQHYIDLEERMIFQGWGSTWNNGLWWPWAGRGSMLWRQVEWC